MAEQISPSTHIVVQQHDTLPPSITKQALHQPLWKFNNLLVEIISTILSYFVYKFRKPNLLGLKKFISLNETIQHVRLSCRQWNEAILLDYNKQLLQYYLQNKANFDLHYMKHFSNNMKMPKLIAMPSTFDNPKQLFPKGLFVLIQNKKIVESFYASEMEHKRLKTNMIQLLERIEYPRWMAVATAIYLCLMIFFAMLTIQDVFISVYGSIIKDIYIRYFYNLVFAPLYFIFFIVLFSIVINTFIDGCQRNYTFALRNALLTLGGPSLFCAIVMSTIFMIQLNMGILPLYTTPSLFGRTEMIPWPFVFLPWSVLLTFSSLVFGGSSLFLFAVCCRDCEWRPSDVYLLSVFSFMFLQSLLCLLLVVWVSIALEFPFIISSTYIFIPAYVMEFLLVIYTCFNIFMEVKSISNFQWKNLGWQRSLCLFGVAFGMAFNHALCSTAWYHWVPLAVAYVEVMIPSTCFYIWTMMMLYSKRPPSNVDWKSNIKPARRYSYDFVNGTWAHQLRLPWF